MKTVVIICSAHRHQPSPVSYSVLLGHELRRAGYRVVLVTRLPAPGAEGLNNRCFPTWRVRDVPAIARAVAAEQPDEVFLHYVPQIFNRYGVTPVPILLAWWLRRLGVPLTLSVHEAYMPLGVKPSWTLLGVIHRAMLESILPAVQAVLTSTEVLGRSMRRWRWWAPDDVTPIPVGCNIVPAKVSARERAKIRRSLGVAKDGLLLTFFGSLHPSKLVSWVFDALEALGDQPVRLAMIGVTEADLARRADLLPQFRSLSDRISVLGFLEEDEASRYLSATDLFLLPLDDGLTVRRGSLMAGLAHGLPVAGTWSGDTESVLLNSGAISLTPVEDRQAFVDNVARLAADPAERARLGAAGRELYQRRFDWRAIAQQFQGIIERRNAGAVDRVEERVVQHV